jgi:DNA invertase Pin-like site-specific DNA recombinase
MSLPFSPGDHVFAYLRDSGHANQDLSVGQQEDAVRAWCAQHGLVLSTVYKDEAKPGSSIVGRQNLHAMMNAFRHNCQEAGVIVWKYNRFARTIDNAQYLRAEIRTRGYVFFSMNDVVPDGPAGRLLEAAIDYTDEQYLVNLSIDVKRGLRDLVVNYGCMPGRPPAGFKREKVVISTRRDGTPHIGHRWVPDPVKKARVRQAFKMRAAGASLGEINKATQLFRSINSYATFWPNQLYLGILHYGEDLVVEHYCEPMVDRETFDQVQAIQAGLKRYQHLKGGSPEHPRRKASNFLLSGIAHCGRCGAPMYGQTSHQRNGTKTTSYLCTRAYRNRDCIRRRIPAETFENAVIRELRDHWLKPEYLQAAFEQLRASHGSRIEENKRRRRQLVDELAEIRRQQTNMTEAIALSEKSVPRALVDKLGALEEQEAVQRSRIAELDAGAVRPVPEIPLEVITSQMARLDELLAGLDIQKKRAFLRGLVARVDVDREDNKLFGLITFYYPPDGGSPPDGSDPPDDNLPRGPGPGKKGGTVAMSRKAPEAPRYRYSHPFSSDATASDKRYKNSRR